MKTIYLISALLFSSLACAGELRHLRAEGNVSGEAMQHMQREFEKKLGPYLLDRPAVVEPTIVDMKFVGGGKRFLFGPFAGGSYVTLRVRITEGDRVTEETFYETGSAFSGAVTVGGTDNLMLARIANRAVAFVRKTIGTASVASR